MIHLILQSIWLLLPMGVANMSPVIFRHQLTVLAKPVDANLRFLGQPLFGDHKTWRGIIFGALAGGVVFIVQQLLYEIPSFQYLSLFDYKSLPSHLGFVVGFSALFGDLIKSFIKRRIGIQPGKPWIPFDQLDYVVGGLAGFALYLKIDWPICVLTVILGFFLHILIARIGYYLKIKDAPW